MVHEVKIKIEYADRIVEKKKHFEVRFNDRDYQVGDFLKFRVLEDGTYINRYHELESKEYEIIYIHSGLGMKEGYIVLGINPSENNI